MSQGRVLPTVESVNSTTSTLKTLNWPLVVGLGAFALIRPLVRIIADRADLDLPSLVPIAMTVGITVVWVAVAGFTRAREPLATLVCAALVYGVLAIVLSAVLSPILLGHLEGPLANPIAIIPMLIVNACWGLIAGALALAVRRARGTNGQA